MYSLYFLDFFKSSIKTRFFSYTLIISILLIFSFYISFYFSSQLPLERHSFRQTQTALSSFWLAKEGFKIDYITPVLGPNWSIPFEFPIYQTIVAFISSIFNLDLNIVGRLTSYIFLLLSIHPIILLFKILKIKNESLLIFIILYLSSPSYLYWGRSFMIETAALYFSIFSLYFFTALIYKDLKYKYLIGLFIFLSMSFLQKITTIIPVITVLSISLFLIIFKNFTNNNKLLSKKYFYIYFVIFASTLIGYLWVLYSDSLKMKNLIAISLVSTHPDMIKWNWGSLSDRFSFEIWNTVFIKRIALGNLGIIGGILFIIPFFFKNYLIEKQLILFFIVLGLFPIFLFPNLYFVHDYYLISNLIFFLIALSISLGVIFDKLKNNFLSFSILFIIIFSNIVIFNVKFLPAITIKFDSNNQDFSVGKFLNKELKEDEKFIAFGNDWSSTFSYISERKSLTVPPWFSGYNNVINNPFNFINKNELAAIVKCSTDKPSLLDLFNFKFENNLTKISLINSCYIATKEVKYNNLSKNIISDCNWVLNRPNFISVDSFDFIYINGSLFNFYFSKDMNFNIFIKASDNSNVNYYEVSTFINGDDYSSNYDFSRILIPTSFFNSTLTFSLIFHIDGNYYECNSFFSFN